MGNGVNAIPDLNPFIFNRWHVSVKVITFVHAVTTGALVILEYC